MFPSTVTAGNGGDAKMKAFLARSSNNTHSQFQNEKFVFVLQKTVHLRSLLSKQYINFLTFCFPYHMLICTSPKRRI